MLIMVLGSECKRACNKEAVMYVYSDTDYVFKVRVDATSTSSGPMTKHSFQLKSSLLNNKLGISWRSWKAAAYVGLSLGLGAYLKCSHRLADFLMVVSFTSNKNAFHKDRMLCPIRDEILCLQPQSTTVNDCQH